MPRKLTPQQQQIAETVFETIAAMLPAGGMCERIYVPDLVRGLGMDDDPRPLWQALRDLTSMELITLSLIDPSAIAAGDIPLLMNGPQISSKKADGKDEWLPIGYISLRSEAVCGPTACAINARFSGYPPVCGVDKITDKDLEVIRITTGSKSSQLIAEAAKDQAKIRKLTRECKVDLREYDLIAVSSSGGKDSQAMLDAVMRKCCELGIEDRVHVYHGDLKTIEWSGSKEIAKLQADHYGVGFTAVSNERFEDLLDHVSQRGEWPSGGAVSRQYCTADMKRQPINKQFTVFANEWWKGIETGMEAKLRKLLGSQWEVDKARGVGTKNVRSIASTYKKVMKQEMGEDVDLALYRPKILNCIGVRAEESRARAKKAPLTAESSIHGSSGQKRVDTWFPIFTWTRRQVWEVIAASGVPHHWAYDIGMPRLSCVFCVMANQAAIAIGAEYNPELFQRFIQVEDELRSRESLICGSSKIRKSGCLLTAKGKRRAADLPEALDQEACPLDYEPGYICVPKPGEIEAYNAGRRDKKPDVTPARPRQWRFGMGMSIREIAEKIERCKKDPTREECRVLGEDPTSESFL